MQLAVLFAAVAAAAAAPPQIPAAAPAGGTQMNVTWTSPGANAAWGLGTYTSGSFTLQGTLMLPPGASAANKVPAVLLIGGSGGDNRYACLNIPADVAGIAYRQCLFEDVAGAVLASGAAGATI